MLNLSSDYTKGCHHEILERLAAANDESFAGYGQDDICVEAKRLILDHCALDDAQVFFLAGGTQTNQIATKALLDSWQGVVAADTGHVATHEAGAIEHAGHKVLTLPGHEGKIEAAELAAFLHAYRTDENRDHMVEPGMVYISQPTEYGTVYTLAELEAISSTCRGSSIPLYIDGARLGYALAAPGNDASLEDIARLADGFYIGGTKLGALFGEALVFPNMRFPKLLSLVKQSGALLAKGWVVGLQFRTMLETSEGAGLAETLYMKGAQQAIACAHALREGLVERGYELALDSPTNQQFIVADDGLLERLNGKVRYGFWEKLSDGRTIIRLATSWYTTQDEVEALLSIL